MVPIEKNTKEGECKMFLKKLLQISAALFFFLILFQNCGKYEFTSIENLERKVSNIPVADVVHTGKFIEAHVVEGRPVSLSLAEKDLEGLGSDTGEMSFQWFKKGDKGKLEALDGETSLQLSFDSAQLSDKGEYVLLLQGTEEQIVARALLNVEPKLSLISSDLISETLLVGETKRVHVLVSGPKNIKVRWQLKREGASVAAPFFENTRVNQEEENGRTKLTSEMILKDVKEIQSGLYSVLFTSGHNTNTEQKLLVGPEQIKVERPVDLSGSITGPRNVKIGSAFVLQAVLNSSPGQIKYQWSLDGNLIKGATGNKYQVSESNFFDEGSYTVKVFFEDKFLVLGPHKVILQCGSNDIRYKNTCKPKRIECKKDGHPGLSDFDPINGIYKICRITKCQGSLVLDKNVNICKCPAAMPVEYGNYQCRSACEKNEIFNSQVGQCLCKRGTERVEGQCLNTCKSNEERINGLCVSKCLDIQVRNNAGQCLCPNGTELVGGKCLNLCGQNETRNSNTNMCICNSNSERYNGQCVAKCRSGEERVNGHCVARCKDSEVRNSAGQCRCPGGQKWRADVNQCITVKKPVLKWVSAPSASEARKDVRFIFDAYDGYNKKTPLKSLFCSIDGQPLACSQGANVNTRIAIKKNFMRYGTLPLRIAIVDRYGEKKEITHQIKVSCTKDQIQKNGKCLFKPYIKWTAFKSPRSWLVKNNEPIVFKFMTHDPDRLIHHYMCRVTKTQNAEQFDTKGEKHLGRQPLAKDFGWEPCKEGHKFNNPLTRLGTGPHMMYAKGVDASGKRVTWAFNGEDYSSRAISYPRRVVLWAPHCVRWTQVNIGGKKRSQCYKCQSGYKINLRSVRCER